MAKFEEGSTPSISNFDTAIAGQTNAFFLPAVYSKNVQNFFRKASVVEAITNTDYAGEISAFGDTVVNAVFKLSELLGIPNTLR